MAFKQRNDITGLGEDIKYNIKIKNVFVNSPGEDNNIINID